MSYSLQMASPINEEIAPVAADLWALGFVFPGQPASRFSMHTTAQQMAPSGRDSRRVYDRDGIQVYRARRREHAQDPLPAQRQRANVGSQGRPELSWGPPGF